MRKTLAKAKKNAKEKVDVHQRKKLLAIMHFLVHNNVFTIEDDEFPDQEGSMVIVTADMLELYPTQELYELAEDAVTTRS